MATSRAPMFAGYVVSWGVRVPARIARTEYPGNGYRALAARESQDVVFAAQPVGWQARFPSRKP